MPVTWFSCAIGLPNEARNRRSPCNPAMSLRRVLHMNTFRRGVIGRGLAAGLMTLALTNRAAQSGPTGLPAGTRAPNIVFVLADQWRGGGVRQGGKSRRHDATDGKST